MRKILVGALVASAFGITAPHAAAADSSAFAGGCFGVRVSTAATEIVGVVTVYSTEAAENPVTATVTCRYVVTNTGASATRSFTANPAGQDLWRVLYTPQPGDVIQVCTIVDYTSNTDATDTSCRAVTDVTGTTDTVNGVLEPVLDLIADGTAGLDPILCGALKTAGVPAVVNATTSVSMVRMDTDDCDLYLSDSRLIDFVPYED